MTKNSLQRDNAVGADSCLNFMKVLLAGPGTGKTAKIKSIISSVGNGSNVLVVSFTNATVKDLSKSLATIGVTTDNCMTLHKLAVKYNHDKTRHVLLRGVETNELEQIAKSTGISFERLCDFLSCTTFQQMIRRFVSYANANGTYLKEKLSHYDVLIVDEYQDFNPDEQALIDVLIELIPEAYILGDDDQCIYDFKDASSDRLITIHSDPSNKVLEHEHKCYRCPDAVVEHATNLILKNEKRAPKEWHKTGKPGDIFYDQLLTLDDVAGFVSAHVQRIVESNPNDSVLILTPVEFAAEKVIEQLSNLNIVHTNYFSERIPEALVIESWKLKSVFGDHRYLNLVLLGYLVYQPRKPLYTLLKKHFDNGKDIEELFDLLERKLPDLVKRDYSTVDQMLTIDELQDLRALYESANGETESEKLERLLIPLEEKDESNIKVMSIHKSKGLGSDHVFMVGLTEGVIPNKKKGNDTIESQRRLFYVGMTRAQKSLHLVANVKIPGKYAHIVNKSDFKFDYKSKMYNGRASTFIEELNLKKD